MCCSSLFFLHYVQIHTYLHKRTYTTSTHTHTHSSYVARMRATSMKVNTNPRDTSISFQPLPQPGFLHRRHRSLFSLHESRVRTHDGLSSSEHSTCISTDTALRRYCIHVGVVLRRGGGNFEEMFMEVLSFREMFACLRLEGCHFRIAEREVCIDIARINRVEESCCCRSHCHRRRTHGFRARDPLHPSQRNESVTNAFLHQLIPTKSSLAGCEACEVPAS